MAEHHDVVVVGGGQAGLATGWHLQQRGIDHVLLERARVAERWRTERWDSLMFQFTREWLNLPGFSYDGPEPDGFAHHTEVLDRIERYHTPHRRTGPRAHRGRAPSPRAAEGWEATTSAGPMLAPGGGLGHRPLPARGTCLRSARLPSDVVQVHASRLPQPSTRRHPAVCWWWGAARRASRSPRSCWPPVDPCTSP